MTGSTLHLSIDAMGGDHAPASVVGGIALARKKYPDLRFTLFGDADQLHSLLSREPLLADGVVVHHTDEIIDNEMKPSIAVRRGKNSSMSLAIAAVKEGKSDAVISAGNTGALMAISKVQLRMLEGIARPAIVSLVPTLNGQAVMLDLGANIGCSALELEQFAIMGDAFAKSVLKIERPRIGLLNIGSEAMKGGDELKEAFQKLTDTPEEINFVGFIEGNDIAMGAVDVVVTDGFTGNVALKTAEGTAKLISTYIKSTFKGSWTGKFAGLLMMRSMKMLKKKLDPRQYNGAMLVGLNGISVKSHGGSDALAFYHAVKVAVELVNNGINQQIINELKISHLMAEPQNSNDAEMPKLEPEVQG